MTKAADDYESIARHLKELEAEKQLALTGSSAPVQVEAPKDIDWTSTYGVYAAPSGYTNAAHLAQGALTPQYHLNYNELTNKILWRAH